MKFRYDKKDDVMLVWLSKSKVYHAEQSKSMILHYSKDGKLVLMEILNASKFIKEASDLLPSNLKQSIYSAL